MKKSVLLQTIETPNGDTDAYEIISSILESKADDLGMYVALMHGCIQKHFHT